MSKRLPKSDDRRIGPYSRAIDRGAKGDAILATSREGRFLDRIEAELLAQLGIPTFSQKLLVRRVAKTMLRLELLDEKLAGAVGTDHDERAYNALSNSVRLGLRELGLRPADPAPQSTQDYILGLAKRGSEK